MAALCQLRLCLLSSFFAATLVDGAAFAGDVTYSRDIKPILDAGCVECHHEGARGPNLSRFPFVLGDENDQDAIVGKILQKVDAAEPTMPPGARPKLTPAQVGLIKAWRGQGLPAGDGFDASTSETPGSGESAAEAIESLIPADRLERIKAALPAVADPNLSRILTSEQTLWYDDEVMTPSYQDSLGASSNSKWPDLVAASETVISGLHDRQRHRWRFPFATTAGTDASTNLQVTNFIALPQVDNQILSIPIWKVRRNYNRIQWMWVYPVGTVVGEVLFIVDGDQLLPVEVRTRTRQAQGWSTNAHRPFPTATSLAEAVKSRRPDWQSRPNLARLVSHLESSSTLTPKTLAARAALAPTFQQEGWLDVLPDFGDPQLVRGLLTTTSFKSAFDTAWKKDGAKAAFAAATAGGLAIVPNHYDAGLLQVTDDACMRCHKDTGRLVSEFYDDLYLYGELWGKDGIFSFHPYDESRYPELRSNNENRSINPVLRRMGVFEEYDPRKHVAPLYPPLEPIPPAR
jgi:cytochrome c553